MHDAPLIIRRSNRGAPRVLPEGGARDERTVHPSAKSNLIPIGVLHENALNHACAQLAKPLMSPAPLLDRLPRLEPVMGRYGRLGFLYEVPDRRGPSRSLSIRRSGRERSVQ